MPQFRQLDLAFGNRDVDLDGTRCPQRVVKISSRKLSGLNFTSSSEKPIQLVAASTLQQRARELLCELGAHQLATEIRVEWNSRLKTCAGRADYREKLITLNPQLANHPGEIDQTVRHELAHLLAKFRARRRRILPHGAEWREACHDLGIGDEKRCHNLPFAGVEHRRRFLYRCPSCYRDFPRVRRIKRAVACLACCRAYNRGDFDLRFKLQICSGGL